MIHLRDLSPSKEFKDSLVGYSYHSLEELELPQEIICQLCDSGVPINSHYSVFDENPITFYQTPQIQRFPLIPGTYLEIAEMKWIGKIAICINTGEVWQIFKEEFRRSFMNSSIGQYVNCLGAWLQFYPQFQSYLAKMISVNPVFSLFENPEIYCSIKHKFSEIDSKAMECNDNYWPRCCEPDII